MCDLQSQLNFERADKESALLVRNIMFYQEVVRESENVKDELKKLKLDMASLLEEKTSAEKDIQASSSKVLSYASSMRTLRNEISGVREERVLKELARIEAMNEFEAIEAQRGEEFNQFSVTLENTKSKMNQILVEIDRAKEMESKLSVTMGDVSVLQIGLEMAKASEKYVRRSESMRFSGASSHEIKELESITDELVSAKKELEMTQGEAIQVTASMDIIRNKLIRVRNEMARLKKAEKENETHIQDLNSMLLRAKEKLGSVSAAEAKGRAIVSGLTLDLVQLKTKNQAAKKETELILEQIKKLEALIRKTDSEIELDAGRLDAATRELESLKSSELRAVEDLRYLIESKMQVRDNISQQNSSILISKSEYEYLTERVIRANMIADKKVAAAQAWIEALKASEKGILMKIKIEGKPEKNKTISDTNSAMKNQVSGSSEPARKARHRKSISLAARTMSRSSITTTSKKKGSTPIDTDP